MITFTEKQLADFRAFNEVQNSRTYNMMSHQARMATGLSKDAFFFVIENYMALANAAHGEKV